MNTLREACARVHSFFRKQKLDLELDEELAAHIELATEDHVRQGMSLPEARRLARIQLGGIDPMKELHRDSRGLPWLEGIIQDVRHSIRGLRRSPGFALTAIATLAIGIGVNTAVFTVTNAVLLQGFRLIDRNDRILYINSQQNGQYSGVSYSDFQDWRTEAKSFEGLGAVADLRITLNGEGGFPERYTATRITTNAFRLLGQRPILGRDFVESDATLGAPPVAILNYRFWERRYGKDSTIIGQTLHINGAPPTTVIGVMPDGFSFPQNQDLWIPLTQTADLQPRECSTLMVRFRPYGRWGDEGECPCGTGNDRETVGEGLPTNESGPDSAIREFFRVLHWRKCDADLRGHLGSSLLCTIDCLFQSGESYVGSRDWQIPRDFGPHRPRGGALANHKASPHREPCTHQCRGRVWMAHRQMECTSLRAGC